MSNLTPALRPVLPVEGESITILGLSGTVEYVEPQDDWTWRIVVKFTNGGGNNENMVLFVPTDYRTTDGQYCWEAEAEAEAEDAQWSATQRMESMACDR